jgi:hypothetical protein
VYNNSGVASLVQKCVAMFMYNFATGYNFKLRLKNDRPVALKVATPANISC